MRVPLYPSTGYAPADSPCPDCGRYGGTPHLTHGGEAPDGTPDASLAGLRCTAEALARLLRTPDADFGAADAYADALAAGLARLDRLAGGQP